MLTANMVKKLNRQVNLEAYSANLYLALGSWCEYRGLKKSAAFLYKHSKDETGHMEKLFNYINATDAEAIVSAIDKPKTNFKTIKDVFKATYQHEQYITKEINSLVDYALKEKDYSTFNFLQWYVAEQHEEEALFKDILDKIDMIGLDSGYALFLIDKEIGSLC